jgi:1,4-alpha-glucan branching enzyme
LLENSDHRGIQTLVRDLNRLYTTLPALHRKDCEGDGFAWIDCHDYEQGVLSFRRHSGGDTAVVVCNFTPVPRHGYRIGVPQAGGWREIFNSDSSFYGGSNLGNAGRISAEAVRSHDLDASLVLTIPPLAVLVLVPDRS